MGALSRMGGIHKRVTYLEKRDDLSREQFGVYWATEHARIAKDLPGVVRYLQNHVNHLEPCPAGDDPYRVDGIVELWFGDENATSAGYASDVADRLVVDEKKFLGGLTGGPVDAAAHHDAWPHKVWLLGRWAADGEAGRAAVEAWINALAPELPEPLGLDTNVLQPDARLLLRAGLRREEEIPEMAVALGYSDSIAARSALGTLWENLAGLEGILRRVHLYQATELQVV